MGCGTVRVGGITWSALKSDLIYFRLPAPDGSAIASRGTYIQMTDADSFITCVQMATRAPSCINYSWLVHMRTNIKHPLSLRKRAVPRSKLQLGHHYIRKPADASLWVRGRNFYILSTIQIRQQPSSEHHPGGLRLICMGTRQNETFGCRPTLVPPSCR
jgi:hypothetical protein